VSRPESGFDEPRGVLVRREKTSIYTVLLMITLGAVCIGCLIMILELWRYGFQYKPSSLRSEVHPVAAPVYV
jgi:hypothetical protein